MVCDRARLQYRVVKQHVNALAAGPCANLVYAGQRFKQAFDALLAALTDESQSTGDFQRDDSEHLSNPPYARTGDGSPGACPTPLMASKKYARRPHRELIKIDVTLAAMATIPQIG